MTASDILITAVGWAATGPREIHGDGVPYTDFRLAHTARRFDGERWVDGRTVWFTVKAFRDLARNVAESVHKGQPVVVHGRLRTETWTGPSGERTTNVLEALAVGHNLSWGTGTFGRRVYRSPEDAATEAATTPDAPAGAPGAGEEPYEDPFAVAAPGGFDAFVGALDEDLDEDGDEDLAGELADGVPEDPEAAPAGVTRVAV